MTSTTIDPLPKLLRKIKKKLRIPSFFFTKENDIYPFKWIESFNIDKNEKNEFANKLTTSKLIVYNDIMPKTIYDKIKVDGNTHASAYATLMPKSLIE